MMCQSEVTCLYVDCCFSDKFTIKFQLSVLVLFKIFVIIISFKKQLVPSMIELNIVYLV